jgi:hypothetical protein
VAAATTAAGMRTRSVIGTSSPTVLVSPIMLRALDCTDTRKPVLSQSGIPTNATVRADRPGRRAWLDVSWIALAAAGLTACD